MVTAAANEWKFTFDNGEFATSRVNRELNQDTGDGTQSTGLRVSCTPSQTVIVEESLGYLGAVSTREVPDGENFIEDNTSSNHNFVTIDPADGGNDLFTLGDYVVEEFETVWLNDEFYEVKLVLSLDSELVTGFGRSFGRYFGT